MNFDGDPNLGMYGFANDRYCIVGKEAKKIHERLHEVLKVPVHTASTLNTELVGIFCSGNSSGVVIPDIIEHYEKEHMKKLFDKVLVLKSRYTAFGNLILMNDNGIILSPFLKDAKTRLEEFFNIPCEVTTIAGINIVGKLGFATNKGCVVHPKIRGHELDVLKKTLGVDVAIGTVNFGSSYPGSGLIANSNGFVASEVTSGHELGNINEAMGFI
jgi:translation initiation factor 6